MDSSPGGRCGEVVSDMAVVFVTVAQLIFFAFFHQYIAWYTTEPDGSVTRLSMLTDDYFTWLPFPITASIVVIVASIVMIIYDRYWFRQTAWILFCLMGIAVCVSLVTIFPFDFSVIPNAAAVDVVPKVVTGFFILMAVFYGTTALVMFVKLRSHITKK
ncbi:MAG TPA: hypothetical protein VLY63_09145 [Anaerolineae bacterium]|nr:hypothetical protein [Anaerolineae bacterium]